MTITMLRELQIPRTARWGTFAEMKTVVGCALDLYALFIVQNRQH